MRAYPNRGLLAASLVVGLALVACGQSASSGVPGGTGQAATPAGGEPTAPPDGGQSVEPTPAGGGGGTGSVPTLTDGEWTGGTAHADVTGDVSGTFDANLLAGLASTSGSATQLTYLSAAGEQIAVAINGDTVAVSVGTTAWVGGGGTTTGAQCSATFSAGDATHVAGTVTCTRAPIIDSTGQQGKFADMVVTFEATR